MLNQATRLEDGDLRISYALGVGRTARAIAAGTPIEGWRLELSWVEGAWLVDPIHAHDRRGVAVVDLGPLLERRRDA
jgi:hypothetical protein